MASLLVLLIVSKQGMEVCIYRYALSIPPPPPPSYVCERGRRRNEWAMLYKVPENVCQQLYYKNAWNSML